MALIKCNECGKTVSDKARVCPNCGAPTNIGLNTYAVAGFILSLISIFIHLVSFIAVYMSAKGFDQIKITNEKGKGLAITGVVISILYIFVFMYNFYIYNFYIL